MKSTKTLIQLRKQSITHHCLLSSRAQWPVTISHTVCLSLVPKIGVAQRLGPVPRRIKLLSEKNCERLSHIRQNKIQQQEFTTISVVTYLEEERVFLTSTNGITPRVSPKILTQVRRSVNKRNIYI